MDETEYLLSSKANKKRLLQSIEDAKNKVGLVEFPIAEIEKLQSKLYRLCLFKSTIPLSLHCTMNKLYRHFTSKIIGLDKAYKWY